MAMAKYGKAAAKSVKRALEREKARDSSLGERR